MNELKTLEQLGRIEKIVRAHKTVLIFDQVCDYTGNSRSYMYKLTVRGKTGWQVEVGPPNLHTGGIYEP